MAENKPKEIRRQEILDAAAQCFSKKGYEGTSVQDICEKAAITKGGLYWHFPSKKKILEGLMASLCNAQQNQWKNLEALEISPESIRHVGFQFIRQNLLDEDKIRLFAVLEVEALRDRDIKNALSVSRQFIYTRLLLFSRKVLRHFKNVHIDENALAHFFDLSVAGIVRKKMLKVVDFDEEKCWNNICDILLNGLS